MKQLIYLFPLLLSANLWAQTSQYSPLQGPSDDYLDREQTLQPAVEGAHTSLRPFLRSDLRKLVAQSADSSYLLADNALWDSLAPAPQGFWSHFYQQKANLYALQAGDFYFSVNPLLHLQAGGERLEDGTQNLLFLNRRGLHLEGDIAKRLFFSTTLTENQAAYPAHIQNRISEFGAVPGAGFYKVYDSQLTDAPEDGVDYLLAQGHIGFQLMPYISARLGHGRHFIGDGHRSLLLSDFSNNYFYLQLDTRIWRFHYRNIFAELTQDHAPVANGLYPKKYLAAHYLDLKLSKTLQIGLFEAIVFGREQGFELQYLNPIIFYRAVEQGLGSPDNAMLGLNFRWDFLRRFAFYGQVVIDEFAFSEVFRSPSAANGGWWANKQGLQLGLKYRNVANINHLDLQLEFNTVRPYTYTFRDSSASYTHYNQPLAHPLGANFREFLAIIRYQPMPKLQLRAQCTYAFYGQDSSGSNWGSNIHLSYITREQEYGNRIGQGLATHLLYLDLLGSYQLYHNLYVDLGLSFRQEKITGLTESPQAVWGRLGLRWNMLERRQDF
ncbi:hypothetical protein PPO43_04255 [Saprospira sp. CCB-QB6]|uniref:hypothetical protein n=1 Tax=Saprospira sp. CCB-QB6 TaxID=3023936 RepID=UPI002348F908|nr:hypothetical protein [Saprospira sp. CCB-QB6]WCL82314.1 hypothetical protein PPO43_04255 [Saprospira sp. CCB-QB6]